MNKKIAAYKAFVDELYENWNFYSAKNCELRFIKSGDVIKELDGWHRSSQLMSFLKKHKLLDASLCKHNLESEE